MLSSYLHPFGALTSMIECCHYMFINHNFHIIVVILHVMLGSLSMRNLLSQIKFYWSLNIWARTKPSSWKTIKSIKLDVIHMGNNDLSRLTLILKQEGMLFRFSVDEGIPTISFMYVWWRFRKEEDGEKKVRNDKSHLYGRRERMN